MDTNISYDLDTKISRCSCTQCRHPYPFFFEIKQQPIMLITACPSIQTICRPLTSVRFFRQLIYSLLGEEGLSEKGLSLFHDNRGIYWTHLKKCYNENFFINKKNKYDIPDSCKKYIEEEMHSLLQNLKLIIIIGGITNGIAYNRINNYINKRVKIVSLDYLHESRETTPYDDIRRLVADILKLPLPSKKVDRALIETRRKRSDVHLSIDLEAQLQFIKMDSKRKNLAGVSSVENNLDKLWIHNLIIPQKERYSHLISCWNSIESITKAFLLQFFDPNLPRHKSTTRYFKDISVDISHYGVINHFLEDWPKALKEIVSKPDFFNYSSIDEKNKRKNILEKLFVLKTIRNIIVHNDGYIPKHELYKVYNNNDDYYELEKKIKSAYEGIYIYTNMIFLDKNAIRQIADFMCDYYDYILHLDNYLSMK